MTNEFPYSLGTPVRVKLNSSLHNGYITAVHPPETSHSVYQYDVKLFQTIYGITLSGIDKIERVTYIWLQAIGGGDL